MTNRSCGTCRDRRILCDRALPTCTRCSQSNRMCQGYGLRLSWPKASNTKRSMVGQPSHPRSAVRQSAEFRLLNTSTWDLELHSSLLDVKSSKTTPPTLHTPKLFSSRQLDVADETLFQYFQCTASRCMTTFGHDPTDLGNLLLRMALGDSPSAVAVLRGILALSSLHRDGLQSQAGRLKISALRALVAAPKADISTTEAAQHVAAGMLLCSFDIHQLACTSGQWTKYVIGAKSIIKTSLSKDEHCSEFRPLLDWVHYHDVLSRFSMLHWHRKNSDIEILSNDIGAELSPLPSPYSTTLCLLFDVCNTVSENLTQTTRTEGRDQHKAALSRLAIRIRNIVLPDTASKASSSTTTDVELFQSAMLVYLNRSSGGLLDPADTEERIGKAFSTLSQLRSCERQFPLFILGCEARTDDERCTVLDLITRTEKLASSRSFFLVRKMIEAIWVQDDLSNKGIDYATKLSAIISCCTILPSFV
ncbi:hypothetical protein BO94DRAFT_299621 [Aspergillus sclerotioniger CBS 115572]|uniref:Zn(2)-C6 fungal-type domain-containing protein n=1 Tax=Aspergillus sclerotioniger CBS 115572 TaxID=1450535 RepID=A0A317V608_9EURO|nr:hypothetical protein BO94DRAFT_299621 [Aspergillus sclerotioniger CBS 115572]PWY68969.1 hypothetical protein BO94DRAFT_299621 [Aspergillus sclerotioniger CBS 115572]